MRDDSPARLGFSHEQFPSWRRYQRYGIDQTVKAFEQDHQTVILNGPTGTGKSLLACAVARRLGQRALILVGTKQLANQYAEAFGDLVVVVKGRNNFKCPEYPDLTADLAPCSVSDEKDHGGCALKFSMECPYYNQKAKAVSSNLVVTSYSYALNELNYVGKLKRELLILDEAHRTENELMSWIGISIDKRILEKHGVRIPHLRGFSRWQEWARVVLPGLELKVEEAREKAGVFNFRKEIMKEYARLERAYKNLRRLAGLKETWLEEHRAHSVYFKPIWVNKYAKDSLLRHGENALLMSATPPFPRVLGIEDYQYIEIPSTFPVRIRPFLYDPQVKLSHSSTLEQLPRLAVACDRILDRYPNYKGVIHTSSYLIRDGILANSEYPERFLTHQLEDREDVLDEFFATDKPKVLLSPSMGEGVSFDYDLARFQVICKMPFPDLGDEQIRARAAEDRDWYQFSAASALVQTYGRIVRAEDDWGNTHMLDGQFGWHLKRYEKFYPEWFRSAIIWRR